MISLGLKVLAEGLQTIQLESMKNGIGLPSLLKNDWIPLSSEDEYFCWADLLCKLQTQVAFFSSCCFSEPGIKHICNQKKCEGP